VTFQRDGVEQQATVMLQARFTQERHVWEAKHA
jgi:hypothetical protein